MPDPAWSTIFLVLIVAVNFMGVRIYGELEYWFALIKILIVIVFIIIGKKEKTLRSQLRWYSMI